MKMYSILKRLISLLPVFKPPDNLQARTFPKTIEQGDFIEFIYSLLFFKENIYQNGGNV